MEFCEKCGSRMTITKEGLLCPKCHNMVRAKPERQLEKKKHENGSDGVYVSGSSAENYSKISRVCPQCGNKVVFHWFSDVLGEHAGVRQERTVEHFRCSKCAFSWTE